MLQAGVAVLCECQSESEPCCVVQVTAVMLKAISGVAAASRHNSRAHARQTAGDNGSSQRANGNGLTQAVCIASDRDSGSGMQHKACMCLMWLPDVSSE